MPPSASAIRCGAAVASPEVWAEAQAIVQAAADALGLLVSWPNAEIEEPEALPDGTLPPFLAVEIEADGAEPIELGGATWDEQGTLWLHLLIPTGSGITEGGQIRKALADAFRGRPGGALLWSRYRFPPGGQDENSGNWYRLSLGVEYSFTDA